MRAHEINNKLIIDFLNYYIQDLWLKLVKIRGENQ